MRKLVCLVIAALMLFSAYSLAQEPVVTLEPIPLEGDLTQARAYADAMEERFGVKILIGTECVDAIHPYSFTIGEGAPSRSPLMYLISVTFTDDELKKLESALAQYPVELFDYIKDSNAPNGLRFLIADQLISNDPGVTNYGYTTCEGGYYNIVLAHTFFKDYCVHHEMWHAMEMSITERYPGAFLIWESLNPPGFQYSYDYAAEISDFNTEYFARRYGTIDGLEDRATIAEAAFYANRNEWFAEHPAIKRKLDAMNLALKDTLIIQYNVKVENDGSKTLQ